MTPETTASNNRFHARAGLPPSAVDSTGKKKHGSRVLLAVVLLTLAGGAALVWWRSQSRQLAAPAAAARARGRPGGGRPPSDRDDAAGGSGESTFRGRLGPAGNDSPGSACLTATPVAASRKPPDSIPPTRVAIRSRLDRFETRS